jgi:hypothetical protein
LYNTVFEQEERKDEKTGLVFQLKIKKVAAYHQYYAVQKAVEQTLRATNAKEGAVKICNCVLGSFSIFSGAFQDKKRVKRAEILDIFASIPSAIMQRAL